jgi:hypothetical protein
MRTFTLFAGLIIFVIAGCKPVQNAVAKPVNDDLDVYRATLASYPYKRSLIRENSSYRGMATAEELLQFMNNEISKETAQDFINANTKQIPLAATLKGENTLIVLSNQEYEGFFQSNPIAGWEELHNRYADVDSGLVSLSAVGYNQNHTEAFVEIGSTQGPKAGRGDFVTLKKIDGKWTVVNKQVVWKS